ncbi:sugar transferase [Blautia sp. MSJ-9]|uniref:sugar transferase n=1 Tax=Blautia sp. MSJ-9 TaxID=2841511 RepID=UPI001C11CD72|nr:sugar transferase [Blautia sp. MSJ-9]MBU5681110.1 sugar transferase [Blautia sp. MSJ-9]
MKEKVREIEKKIKYAVGRVGALLLTILISPILLIISLCIVLDSPGAVIFKQKRLGYRGKEFDIYKFRTMVTNAEKIGDGLVIRSENDNRITRVGRVLRKMSLDELPQFFNIIKGEMCFVGPRPPVTYHPYDGYENYSDEAKKRFEIKPGITGLAQVKLRNAGTWDERIAIDVQYVENYSWWLDIKIIFMTAFSMFNKEEYTSNKKRGKSNI